MPMGERSGIGGILFDKDGTLIDFRATWLAAYRGAAAELCLAAGLASDFATTLLDRSGYDSRTDSFAATSPLLWATNRAIAESWAAEPELRGERGLVDLVLAHFDDAERYPAVAVGDLAALFGRLRGRGLRLGVATMDSTAKAEAAVARLGLGPSLDFVTGYDGGHGEKPGPGMVRGFCAATGLEPGEIVVVGDTAADLQMARAAGAGVAIAVLTGATPRDLLDALADHVLESVMQIEEVI
jgi:phosphoglycolate phosphatase